MRSLTLHLKILIALCVIIGASVTAYQIYVLGIPVSADETDNLWNIDAKVEFNANSREPVKLQMFVPPLNQDYVSLNEVYLQQLRCQRYRRDDNRRGLSARRARGKQTLYTAW